VTSDEMPFMRHWFSGLVNGLGAIDQEARETVLCACGKACAESYTAQVYQEAWEQSTNMDGFLSSLATRFPGATYTRVGTHTIRVNYATCECDLVKCGLIESPLICECSAYNLQENFERTLGTSVSVEIESSILSGGPCCVFRVSLAQ
jgi:hypothetical protein